MSKYGNITDLQFTDIILPEIHPELPNTLRYPEKQITIGDNWSTLFNRSGKYNSYNKSIEYELKGHKESRLIGYDTVTIGSINIKCAHISTNIYYTLNVTVMSSEDTICTNTTGISNGEDWVDIHAGYTVKSNHKVHKNEIVSIDNINQLFPLLESYYQESNQDYRTSTILKDINTEKEGGV